MASWAKSNAILLLFFLSCTPSVKLDSSLYAAFEANDKTGLIEGCGQQVISGFTYCRKKEGEIAGDSLWFIGPPLKCNGEKPCITFKIFDDQGQLVGDGAIPQGQTRVEVTWKSLLKRGTFEIADRGVWGFVYRARWNDPDGSERFTITDGEIVLRVYKREYLPLHEAPNDENLVLDWIENGQRIRVTTKGRTWVQRK